MPVRPAVVTAVILFTFFASSALAQSIQSIGKETLAHLEGVYVLVDHIGEDAERDGLRRSDISVDTKLALRRAGIDVYTKEERLATVSKPYLHVKVSAMKDRTGLYAYNLDLGVKQMVYHSGEAWAVAATYTVAGAIGTVGASNLRDVRNNVQDKLNVFINDWLEVHEE